MGVPVFGTRCFLRRAISIQMMCSANPFKGSVLFCYKCHNLVKHLLKVRQSCLDQNPKTSSEWVSDKNHNVSYQKQIVCNNFYIRKLKVYIKLMSWIIIDSSSLKVKVKVPS